MQFIFNLESTCTMKSKQFCSAVYLHGPKKSVAQVSKLGQIFTTNLDIDQDLCPTARGFHFMVGLVSVYYNLEQDDSLPVLPKGHRAMSVVAVTYTLLKNDYTRVATYGLTYSKSRDKGFNLPGILMLLHRAFMSRPATNKVLLKQYTKDDLSISMPYNIVRAAAILGEEVRARPSCAHGSFVLCKFILSEMEFQNWERHNDKVLTTALSKGS